MVDWTDVQNPIISVTLMAKKSQKYNMKFQYTNNCSFFYIRGLIDRTLENLPQKKPQEIRGENQVITALSRLGYYGGGSSCRSLFFFGF